MTCRRIGVSAYRRDEGRYSRNAPLAFDEPPVCLVDHFNDLAEDLIVGVIKFVKDLLVQVAMDLGFRGFRLRITKLRNEGSLVPPLPPGFSQICTNRARRSSDLVGKGVPFTAWKLLGQFKDTHYQRHSSLINVQIAKMLGSTHNTFLERNYTQFHFTHNAGTPIRRHADTFIPGGVSSPGLENAWSVQRYASQATSLFDRRPIPG